MTDRIREFLHDEAAGGLAILAATIVALIWANVGLDYDGFWHTELGPLDLHHWVNDGLMAVFFLVVGLEIKREVVDGRLQNARTAALPALAAVGGVVAPILIFVAIVAGGDGAEGWAIACATDIAFAVGLIALLGDRVSDGTRVFLLAVAIVDDIIAIAIIAIFYAEAVSLLWLLAAAALAGGDQVLPAAVGAARDRALDRRLQVRRARHDRRRHRRPAAAGGDGRARRASPAPVERVRGRPAVRARQRRHRARRRRAR